MHANQRVSHHCCHGRYLPPPVLESVEKEPSRQPRVTLRGRNLLVHPNRSRVWFGPLVRGKPSTQQHITVDVHKEECGATIRADDLEERVRVLFQDPTLHKARFTTSAQASVNPCPAVDSCHAALHYCDSDTHLRLPCLSLNRHSSSC